MRLRYLRASAITAISVAALPTVLFAWGVWEFMSPGWDSDDSGAVQGFAFTSVGAIVAVVTSAFVFPTVAAYLGRAGRLQFAQFALWSALGVAMAAAVAALLLSWPLGIWTNMSIGLPLLAILAMFFFIVASVLALPFAALWLKLANAA